MSVSRKQLLNKVAEVWAKCPELRLGQLLVDTAQLQTITMDLVYVEDMELFVALEEFDKALIIEREKLAMITNKEVSKKMSEGELYRKLVFPCIKSDDHVCPEVISKMFDEANNEFPETETLIWNKLHTILSPALMCEIIEEINKYLVWREKWLGLPSLANRSTPKKEEKVTLDMDEVGTGSP